MADEVPAMNPFLGLFRHALTALGATLVTNGVLTDGMLQELIGAVISLGSVGWYWYTKPKA